MSVWTHVHGLIQIDSILIDADETEKIVLEILGPPSLWEARCPTTIPEGSEGSLEYRLIKDDDRDSLTKLSIAIFGNLRDYDELNPISTWLDMIVEKLFSGNNGLMVRDLAIHAYVEYGPALFYTLDKEEGRKVIATKVQT